jgi:hypothetical protein
VAQRPANTGNRLILGVEEPRSTQSARQLIE